MATIPVVLALVVSMAALAGCGSSGSAGQLAAAKPLCKEIGDFVHPRPNLYVAVPTPLLTNGEHSGYQSLEAAAVRFQTAIAMQQDQPAVSAAASQVLAACTRLGI